MGCGRNSDKKEKEFLTIFLVKKHKTCKNEICILKYNIKHNGENAVV